VTVGKHDSYVIFDPTKARIIGEEPAKIKPAPERIEIDGKVLLIPPHIQERISDMDKMIADLPQASEIFGFGLTKELQGGETEVVDFISPDKEKIFNFNSLFVTRGQTRLAEILSTSNSLSLQVLDTEIAIVPNNSQDSTDWLVVDIDTMDFVTTQIGELAGFELPRTTHELKAAIGKSKEEKGLEGENDNLSLKSDWDMVVSGAQVSISPRFLSGVRKHADEIGARIGFSTHHHPSLGLLARALADKPLIDRQRAYDTVLKYSDTDFRNNRALGIDFFQIRAFGNLDHPFNPDAGIMSRNYSVKSIEKRGEFS
jgi:hypothetical protein